MTAHDTLTRAKALEFVKTRWFLHLNTTQKMRYPPQHQRTSTFCTALVADDILLEGFLKPSRTLDKMLIPASERVDRRMAKLSNEEAALCLHQQQDSLQSAALHTKTAGDQFLLAA